MGELLDIIGRLERIPGPVALATLLEGEGAGSRRILESAGGAPGTALEEAVQGVLVSGRSQVLADALLERMVPGKLPPWVHFCAQVLRRREACVLVTVGLVEGNVPYAVGDRFVYDARNHGLLPMDGRFSLELQRACAQAREAGGPAWRRFDLPSGALGVALEPLP